MSSEREGLRSGFGKRQTQRAGVGRVAVQVERQVADSGRKDGLAELQEGRIKAQTEAEGILVASQFLQRDRDVEAGVVPQVESQRGFIRRHRAGDFLADFLGFEHRQIAAKRMHRAARGRQDHLGTERE